MISSSVKKRCFNGWAIISIVTLILLSDFNALAQSNEFSDVSRTHPFYVGISFLKDEKVINGYADGSFKSSNPINKAEVTKMIVTELDAPLDAKFEAVFSDVTEGLWFTPHVMKARQLGFVSGNDESGTFSGEKQVNLAEFLKMILSAHNVDVTPAEGQDTAKNISSDAWFANYINYALSHGIINADANGSVDPAKALTRGEVANAMYLLTVIMKGDDTAFLLTRAEAELAQIEVYIAANQVNLAKVASGLAVDFTQQAYNNEPSNGTVLGKAKIARAYDWLVDAFILGIEGKNAEAAQKANDVIDKATEAWQVDPDTQPIAAHIKERAREILEQVGGTET